MANIHMGYMGHCKIDGTQYLITGSSLNPVQTVTAPDVVQGYYMRKGWYYGKVEIGGNVTGPLHEFSDNLWPLCFERNADGDHLQSGGIVVEIAYYKGEGLKFDHAYINSLELSATAGDVVNFTADFLGAKTDETADPSTAVARLQDYSESDCSKLVTWDRVSFEAVGITSTIKNIQSLTVTLNNNLERIYSIRDDYTTQDLYPVDVVAGMREITGSLSLYAEGPIFVNGGSFQISKFGANKYTDYVATDRTTINFTIGGNAGDIIPTTTFDVVFNRPESSATTSYTIYTLNFTAVCDASL